MNIESRLENSARQQERGYRQDLPRVYRHPPSEPPLGPIATGFIALHFIVAALAATYYVGKLVVGVIRLYLP